MTGTERDMHFQRFAKLLWDELMMMSGGNYGWIDVSDDGLDSELIEKYKTLIAQRAYDLVVHCFQNAPTATLEHANLRIGMDEEMQYIPDLTEWPTAVESPEPE